MDLAIQESVTIAAPPERVFDFITAPEAVARTFHGHGPIPAATRSEVVDGGVLRVGAIRRVTNSDGSVIDEEIVALDRPARQGYRLLGGFKRPAAWLIRGARGEWRLDAANGGTRVAWTFTFELRGPLAWPFGALMRRPFRRAMQKALAETRRQVEEG